MSVEVGSGGDGLKRCHWAASPKTKPAMMEYHDKEWGKPVHDDRVLFEFLILEGAQAGLSWETILNKRENYRKAFSGFDARKIAKYDRAKQKALLGDAGIVRNRLKISATIDNAKAFLAVQKEFGTFDEYIWGFVGGAPRRNAWESMKGDSGEDGGERCDEQGFEEARVPVCGSTICYAFMQAVGMVNDHMADCEFA